LFYPLCLVRLYFHLFRLTHPAAPGSVPADARFRLVFIPGSAIAPVARPDW
jgi:hypothetical protein